MSLIDIIQQISIIIQYNKEKINITNYRDIKEIVAHSAKYIWNLNGINYVPENIENFSQDERNTYDSLRGFLLLSFEPKYTFNELLVIIDKSFASADSIIMLAGLIGACYGL
jgi:hypothetical protein